MHPTVQPFTLPVKGKDATEAFEDVGHSDEARGLLPGMLIGEFEKGANVSPSSLAFVPVQYSRHVRRSKQNHTNPPLLLLLWRMLLSRHQSQFCCYLVSRNLVNTPFQRILRYPISRYCCVLCLEILLLKSPPVLGLMYYLELLAIIPLPPCSEVVAGSHTGYRT